MSERGKQIEFPPDETHVKGFEVAMISISIICVGLCSRLSSVPTGATPSVPRFN